MTVVILLHFFREGQHFCRNMCLAHEREVGLHVTSYPGSHLNVKGNFGNGRSKKNKTKQNKKTGLVWFAYSGWVE